MGTTLIALALASSAAPVSTTPYEFAHAFVLQLGTFEGLRKTAIADNDRDSGQSDKVMLDCIHAGTAYDLAVGSAINTMQGMHLRPKFGIL